METIAGTSATGILDKARRGQELSELEFEKFRQESSIASADKSAVIDFR